MANFTVEGKEYIYSGFTGTLMSGTLYRWKLTELGNVQVPVRKGSAEFKRVERAVAARKHLPA